MAKKFGITTAMLLAMLLVLALAQNKPGDLAGTCNANGDNPCPLAQKEVLRLVMIGMTGTGKSATGNMIVGLAHKVIDMTYAAWNKIKPFVSRSSPKSVTVTGKRQDVTVYGREVAIVDTPGFFDTRFDLDTVINEILQCTLLVAPGPHAILLVVRADRQTDEVLEGLELMKKVFGKELSKHLIVVFTYGDNLKRDGVTIEEFVDRLEDPYKDLLQEADNRYVMFDNTLDPSFSDNEQQVRKLIAMADEIVAKNHGQCYKNDILEESYKLMQEEEKRQARKLEEEKEKKLALEAELRRRKAEVEGLKKEKEEEKEKRAAEKELLETELEDMQFNIQRLEQENKDVAIRAQNALATAAAVKERVEIRERIVEVHHHHHHGGGGCFASTSTVHVQGLKGLVTTKTLADLQVGDFVESYDPDTKSVTFSPVYYITYKDDNETVSGLRRLFYEDDDGTMRFLALQPKHMVYANMLVHSPLTHTLRSPPSAPIMSQDINVGDILWIKNTTGHLTPRPVMKIDQVTSHIRHPLTLNHNIIVDGVLASVHMHNEWLLRQVTAPLRLLYNVSPSLNDASLTKKMVQSWDWVEKYLLE